MAEPNSSTFDNTSSEPSIQNAPNSDPDPYSATTTYELYSHASATSLPPSIDPSTLPTMAPLLGSLTGYSAGRRIRTINARLASLSGMLHRPLTPPEEQAVAFHTAKGLGIGSWGPTIGTAAGLGRWWAGREAMRWLWVGKLRDEGVNKAWAEYHQASAREAAEGAAADGAEGAAEGAAPKKPPASIRWDNGKLWVGEKELLRSWNPLRREATLQGLRALPYVGLGWFIASMVMSGYAATVVAVGEMKDERLTALERDLRSSVESTRKRRRGDVGIGREGRDPTGQGTRTPAELWKRHRDDIQKIDGADADDASPSSGQGFFGESEEEERARMSPKAQPPGGGFQRSTQQDQETFKTSDTPSTRYQEDKFRTEPDSPPASFDPTSASPTAQPTSAWDRIRQSSSPSSASSPGGGGRRIPRQQQQQQQQQSRDDHTNYNDNDDSFAFSAREEEKQYARDEAQKAFDARVERERKGGDFG